MAGSVSISPADTHSWAQVLCVLSALYVVSDVAVSFAFQYSARFKILRPWFCSRLFLLFSLSGFSCTVPYGFQEFSLWKCFPRSLLAGCQRGFLVRKSCNDELKHMEYISILTSIVCGRTQKLALRPCEATAVGSTCLLFAHGLVTTCWWDLNCDYVLRVQSCRFVGTAVLYSSMMGLSYLVKSSLLDSSSFSAWIWLDFEVPVSRSW